MEWTTYEDFFDVGHFKQRLSGKNVLRDVDIEWEVRLEF